MDSETLFPTSHLQAEQRNKVCVTTFPQPFRTSLLSPGHATQTRQWLKELAAWAGGCQLFVRAYLFLGFPGCLLLQGFKKTGFMLSLSLLHLYSDPTEFSPSDLLIIFSRLCFLPYFFQLFPFLHYSWIVSLSNLFLIFIHVFYTCLTQILILKNGFSWMTREDRSSKLSVFFF